MKFAKAIMKNFKILFRIKTSLIAIILGPLLIILIIGLAFNSSSNLQIVVGYHAPDNSSLTNEVITELQTTHTMKPFTSKEACKNDLEQGLLHICIDFPQEFVVENEKTNNITFVVDKARINLVYTVIGSVSEKIGFKSEELSKGLTETLTTTLSDTSAAIDNNLGSLIKVRKNLDDTSSQIDTINRNLGNMDLNMVAVSVDFSGDINSILSDTKSLRNDALDVASEGLLFVEDIQSELTGNSTASEALNNFEESLIELNESATSEFEDANETIADLKDKVQAASEKIDAIKQKFSNAKTLTDENRQKITLLKENLETIGTDIDSIKRNLEESSQKISNIKITSTEQIVNPINTNIETVSSDTNQLTILFPYVVLLIIMFVGMMLSSTLVIVEKKSKAYFRVFTTPTRDEFYIFTTFITAFIIVAIQMAIILALASYFFIDLISANLLINSIILLLGISLFILIGMAIGYVTNSQQSTNMASISLGAILLFLSNMVLPIESASASIKSIATYNPYVLASETLRKSILFGADFQVLGVEFLLLLGYSVIILILIVLFQKLSKHMFFRHIPHMKEKKRREKKNEYLVKGIQIHSEEEFITIIKKLNEQEYEKNIRYNKLAKHFIKHRLGKPRIARKMKRFTKKELLEAIAKENKEILHSLKEKIPQQHLSKHNNKKLKGKKYAKEHK